MWNVRELIRSAMEDLKQNDPFLQFDVAKLAWEIGDFVPAEKLYAFTCLKLEDICETIYQFYKKDAQDNHLTLQELIQKDFVPGTEMEKYLLWRDENLELAREAEYRYYTHRKDVTFVDV